MVGHKVLTSCGANLGVIESHFDRFVHVLLQNLLQSVILLVLWVGREREMS